MLPSYAASLKDSTEDAATTTFDIQGSSRSEILTLVKEKSDAEARAIVAEKMQQEAIAKAANTKGRTLQYTLLTR
jgi:hypothetical protein